MDWIWYGLWGVCTVLSSIVAKSKGRREWLWLVIGLLTGIIGLAVVFFMPSVKPDRKAPV